MTYGTQRFNAAFTRAVPRHQKLEAEIQDERNGRGEGPHWAEEKNTAGHSLDIKSSYYK